MEILEIVTEDSNTGDVQGQAKFSQKYYRGSKVALVHNVKGSFHADAVLV